MRLLREWIRSRSGVLVQACALVAAVLGTLSAATCGGDVVVDGEPSGHGGAGQGGAGPTPGSSATTGTGAAGPGPGPGSSTSSSVSSTGPGPGPGPGPTTSVTTGPEDCQTCAEFISTPNGFRLCPGSDMLYAALIGCICTTCAFPCQEACEGGGEISQECQSCVQMVVSGPCSDEFQACANDV